MADLREVLHFEKWHADDDGGGGDEEEHEEQTTHIADEKLKGLSFREKWEVIGSPSPEAFARAEPPLSPLVGMHATGLFSGMTASMKMRNSELVQNRASSALSTPKSSAAARREWRDAHESGSPLRLLMQKSASEGSVLPAIEFMRPDNIGLVQDRLSTLRNRAKPHKCLQNGSQSQPQLEPIRTMQEVAAPRISSPQASPSSRLVMLSEFRRWCVDIFGDIGKAWRSLNSIGASIMKQEDFVTSLKRMHYPQNEHMMGVLYKCLSTGEGIAETSFSAALDGITVGRTARRTSMVMTPEKIDKKREDMNDFEAAFAGYKNSALQRDTEKAMEIIRRNDPALGELLDFLMHHFGNLKLAFKQLDTNCNGSLSMQEFVDGLHMLRSRKGAGPIEAHLVALFKNLDYESKGSIALEDVVYELENNPDLFVVRLLKFCDEVGKKTGGPTSTSNLDEGTMMRHYAGIFRVGHRESQMNQEHFCAALTHMRYPRWHAEDLFRRLDKDDSGNLTLSEFTAFLTPDPQPRRERRGSLVPLGSEQRKKQVKSMHIACASSPKLASLENGRLQASAQKSRPKSESSKHLRILESSTRERPDWLALVESGLSQNGHIPRKNTELSRNGMHVMRGDRECQQDLAPIGCAISDFNEQRERCRISAF